MTLSIMSIEGSVALSYAAPVYRSRTAGLMKIYGPIVLSTV